MNRDDKPDYGRLNSLLGRMLEFNRARNWSQFHNPKDLAISLSLEASEVLEHFQWKSDEEMKSHLAVHGDKVGDELADVLYWVLLMSDYFGIDLPTALDRKMGENEAKYPLVKSKNSHAKYDELA
jgi:NTP pyrophosphatase (non-canonical NTP hydrolase)